MFSIAGMKVPVQLSEKKIYKWAKKYDVPLADCYQLDTNFIWHIKSLDTTHHKENIKNHYQPLQAHYFNKTGYLQSFHINCGAGGYPNLNWDRDSILAFFPPREQTPLDSLFPRDTLMKFLIPLSQTQKFNVANYDYIVVVFWNRWMSKQSPRLIHFIQENCKLAKDEKVKIIYVNNDNVFAYMFEKGGGMKFGR